MEEHDTERILTENQKQNIKMYEEYALWHELNGANSVQTQQAYYTNIMQFLTWYGDRPILEVTKVNVREYGKYLKTCTYVPRHGKNKPAPPSKHYTESSQYEKKKCVKMFLKWLNLDYGIDNLSKEFKLQNPVIERKIDTVLTYDDVMTLLKGCQHPRDKAIIHFLLDSGVRRSELLAIRYGGVHFLDGGVEVTVPPKKNSTEERRVFCVHCSRDMRVWFENHPLKTPDSNFFCGLHQPYGKFTPQGLATQLDVIAQRAGFNCKLYPHLFRHSSASIYTTFAGMNAFKINKRYGWKLSSKMADTYAHLTGKESDDDIRQAFGAPIRKKLETGVEVVYCPRCKLANNVGDDRCDNCDKALSPKAIAEDKAIEEAKKAEAEKAEAGKLEVMKKEFREQMMEEVRNAVQAEVKKSKYAKRYELMDSAMEQRKRKQN